MIAVQPAFHPVDLAHVVLQMPHDGLLGCAVVAQLDQANIDGLLGDASVVVDDLRQTGAVRALDMTRGDPVGRGDSRRPVLAV